MTSGKPPSEHVETGEGEKRGIEGLEGEPLCVTGICVQLGGLALPPLLVMGAGTLGLATRTKSGLVAWL